MMMKRFSLLFLVAFAFISLHAQNWRPIAIGETHHFRSDTANHFPDRSIRVDSVTASPGDTVWHLTRYLQELGPYQAVRNMPGFCQRNLHLRPNGWYQCSDPGNIAIHATAALNETWLLDSIHNKTATVENIWSGTVLGQTDSLKLLRLTGGDSLILSMNHGIVEWPAALGNGHFRLVGLQQQALGDRYPTFDEWFPYQVGQTFFWETFYSIWDGYINNYYGHVKLEVNSVVRDSNGIKVQGLVTSQVGIEINSNPVNWGLVSTFSDDFLTVYEHPGSAFSRLHKEAWTQPDSIVVFYNHDLFDFRVADPAPNYLAQYANSMFFNTVVKVQLSQADTGRVLRIGEVNGNEMGSFEPGTSDTMTSMLYDACEYTIRSGLGLEHVRHQEIDESGFANLVGYITVNGDSVGTIWRTWFMTGAEEPMALEMSTYPNPVNDKLQIALGNAAPWSLRLMDLRVAVLQTATGEGNAHVIEVGNLPSGIYMLQLTQAERTAMRKVVVAH